MLLGGIVGAINLPAQSGDTLVRSGEIRAAVVQGDVKLAYPQGQTAPLHEGDIILPGLSVVTGANSTALLAFANGAVAQLKADSNLTITKFQQAAIDNPPPLEKLPLSSAPGQSITELNLQAGTLVAGILRSGRTMGSAFNITTPAGLATNPDNAILLCTVVLNQGKLQSATIAAAEGSVSFNRVLLAGAKPSGEIVVHAGGKAILSPEPKAESLFKVEGLPFNGAEAQAILDNFYAAVNLARPGQPPLKTPSAPPPERGSGPALKPPSLFDDPTAFPTPITRAIPTHP